MIETRFVILKHTVGPNSERTDHFDFMIEHNGSLLTWAIPKIPDSNATLNALRLPDHRLKYLIFEGELSENRGSVQRVVSGTCTIATLNDCHVAASLRSEMFKGNVSLQLISAQRWRLEFEPVFEEPDLPVDDGD